MGSGLWDLWFVDGATTVPIDLDVDHLVALFEVEGSADLSPQMRKKIANDPLNLMPVQASANRSKGGKDYFEWQPETHKCWYSDRIVSVKAKYGLTVDTAERDALEAQLRTC